MRIVSMSSLLVAGVLCLCSCQNASQKAEPEANLKQTAKTADSTVKTTGASVNSHAQDYLPVRTNSGRRYDTDMPEEPVQYLPGEHRRGLRTPSLPDSLPLTIEGKINPES